MIIYHNGTSKNNKLVRQYTIQSEPSKFRTRKWVDIKDESRRTYKSSNQIEFKTSMIRSN